MKSPLLKVRYPRFLLLCPAFLNLNFSIKQLNRDTLGKLYETNHSYGETY